MKKESLQRIEPKWEACDKENLVERDPGQINNWMVKERSEFILMWKKGFNDQKRPKIPNKVKWFISDWERIRMKREDVSFGF